MTSPKIKGDQLFDFTYRWAKQIYKYMYFDYVISKIVV